MTAQEQLSALGQTVGLEDLAFAANGTCHLIIADDLELTIEEVQGENAVYIYADVCPLPESGAESLYSRLLEANLFGAETGDATFAINKDTSEVMLLKRIPLTGLQAGEFQTQVQEFANWLLSWKSELVEGVPASTGDGVGSSAGGGAFIRV
jgi:hypothetical protein